MTMLRPVLLSVLGLSMGLAQAQLDVDATLTPDQLVEQVLVGNCVTISNVTYNGASALTGPQEGTGSFTYSGSNLGLGAGVILTSGRAGNIAAPASDQNDDNHTPNHSDPDLVAISGGDINDAAVLEFDFVPTGDSISFRYIFASEEYPNYVCNFNDVFGFFLSGPGISGPYTNNAINIALVPGTSLAVAIDNVNNGLGNIPDDPFCPAQNPEYYVNNESPLNPDIIFNGMTVVLTAHASVQCNQPYHIKLAIGDAGGFTGDDTVFDSGVFLEAGSFSSVPFVPELVPSAAVVGSTMYESCLPFTMDFLRTACDLNTEEVVHMTYGGTATMGLDVVPAFPDSLVFAPGVEVVTVNFEVPDDEDGPETMVIAMQTIDCEGNPTTASFNFNIDEVDTLEVQEITTLIACGDTYTFDPQITGGFGQYQYSWSDASTDTSVTVTPTAPTTLQLTVTDLCDLTDTGVQQLDFTPAPNINVTIFGNDEPREGCDDAIVNVIRPQGIEGELTIMFTTAGTATNGTDYVIPAQLILPEDLFSIQQPVEVMEDAMGEPNETAVITGSYTNACSQTVTSTAQFEILDIDPLDVSVNDIETECSNDSLEVIATVGGGVAPYTYLWSTDDTTPSVWVYLQDDGEVRVTVTDDCGRESSATSSILISCELDIPNVISPNNDGRNDRWVITGIGSKQNTVKVYDRWGMVVFDTKNYRNTFTATGLPDGTYFYEVIVEGRNPYTGHLTILRN